MENHYIPQHKFPIKISENIFMLGNYFFNLFLIVGDSHSALFEVGISAVVDNVIKQLESLDIEPDYIISAHPHSDHITGFPGLVKRYPGAQAISAKGAQEFVEHPKAASLMFKEDKFMAKSLKRFDIIPGRPSLEKVPDLKNTLVIDEKKAIDLGSITLDLIKVKGHSPGNLIGVLNKEKIMFCSDSIGFHYPGRGFFPLFFTSADSYLSTLDFIKDFKPLILCPAHQGALTGAKAIQGIQESFDLTYSTIKMIKQSKKSDEALAQQLFKLSYIDEFTLYTPKNIKNCCDLLIKRSKKFSDKLI